MVEVLNHSNKIRKKNRYENQQSEGSREEPLFSHMHKIHSHVPENNLLHIARNILDIYLLVWAFPWPYDLSSFILYPFPFQLITVLWPQWTSFCSSNIPASLSAQGLCTHSSHTWSIISADTHTSLLLITPVSDQMPTFQKIYPWPLLSPHHHLLPLSCFVSS